MDKIRVLLADDHAILRQGIRALLQTQSDIDVVGEAEDGREVVAKVDQLRPDVVLMDIGMPLMDGIEATRQVKREHPEVKVLALTVHDDEEYLFQLLKVGGSGHLLKKASLDEVITAIKTVHSGDVFINPSMTKALVKGYLAHSQEDGEGWTYDRLTPREREVLKLIAEGHTNEEIADILKRSVKTIETHRAHIMEKLDLHDRTELVRYAIRRGLIQA